MKKIQRVNAITREIGPISLKSVTRLAVDISCSNPDCESSSSAPLLVELVSEYAGLDADPADWSSRKLWGTVISPVAIFVGKSGPSACGGAFVSDVADCSTTCSLRLVAPLGPATVAVGSPSPVVGACVRNTAKGPLATCETESLASTA